MNEARLKRLDNFIKATSQDAIQHGIEGASGLLITPLSILCAPFLMLLGGPKVLLAPIGIACVTITEIAIALASTGANVAARGVRAIDRKISSPPVMELGL